jgi:macrolide transport system ATP-binding/permease protein
MGWMRRLFTRRQLEAELDKELCFHFESQVAERIRSGIPKSEARRLTRIEFGGIEQVKEDCRERRGTMWIESLVQDVRYALRQLARTPGFTLTAVLTLALGIGANTAIFTLVNAVLLRNLPVADPKTLVRIGDKDQCCARSTASIDGDYSIFSTYMYEELRKYPEFENLAAMQAGFQYRQIIARREGSQNLAQSVTAEFVSGNYFSTFGLEPAVGRLIADSDDVTGAPDTAVMSFETWKNDYNSDPAIVGSMFWVNSQTVTVVGVAPKSFYGDRLASAPPNFYFPIHTMAGMLGDGYVNDPDTAWLYLVGRLKPGVAWGPLQEKLGAQLKNFYATSKIYSSVHDRPLLDRIHVVVTPAGGGIQNMQQAYGDRLRLLMWIAGLVLLIACANIANLLLVRGMRRTAEMSLRTALGARRGRIVQQLLTESIVLAILSGIAALAVSYGGARMLLALEFTGERHVPIHASPSWQVLAFALGVSIVTGVLFGVAPAWISSLAEPADSLRSGMRTMTGGASLLQRSLVVLQAAFSLVLLVGAGLFTQSLNKLENTDMKLDATNRYVVQVSPQAAGYKLDQLEALARTMEERFHAVPGMVNVGLSTYTPMEDNNEDWGVQIQGQPWLHHQGASIVKANAEYFDAVGTHLLMGRGIEAHDTSTAPLVAVVNQSFVKAFFKPGENPIGRRFGPPGPTSPGDYEVVGVVGDTTYTSVKWKDHAMYFVPLMQHPAVASTKVDPNYDVYIGRILLETARPMANMESIARKTLASINPNFSVVKFETFEAQIGDCFTAERMLSRLTLLFGALALLLASIGLYGVTAYSVARRAQEIGIRMALGASRTGVVGMVMRGAIYQTTLGLAIGIPLAIAGVRFVKAQLYDFTSVSGAVMTGAIVTLAAAACLAALVPARRAVSIDPARALRME